MKILAATVMTWGFGFAAAVLARDPVELALGTPVLDTPPGKYPQMPDWRMYEVPLRITNISRRKVSFMAENLQIPTGCVYERDARRQAWKSAYAGGYCGMGVSYGRITLEPGETRNFTVSTSGFGKSWEMRVRIVFSSAEAVTNRTRTVRSEPVAIP